MSALPRIFISAASREFNTPEFPYRNELHRVLRRGHRRQVRVQEDFGPHSDTLLDQLDEYVRDCDAVIHLTGDLHGATPGDAQVRRLLEKYQEQGLLDRHPTLRDELLADPRASYTQWEAYLALHHGRKLYVFVPADPADDGGHVDRTPRGEPQQSDDDVQSQQRHRQRLDELGWKRESFHSIAELNEKVLSLDLPRAAKGRPSNLPFTSIGTLFKGRDDFLKQLRDSLQRTSDHGATAITGRAVHGLGGVGKTRLAVEYAWRHAEEYSAVLFVTADSPENLRRNLAELVGPLVLDLAEQAATEEEVRVAAALRWLNEHPGWLLILDNVDTEEAAECVEGLLPRLQRGHVLITSRLGRWHGQVQPLELDVLAADDAAEFLLQRTEPDAGRGRKVTADDIGEAAVLAGDLDGLALALEQAGAYIMARRKSLAEYRQLWQQHDARVQTWHDPRAMKYPRSIAVTWQTTLDQLGGDERRLLDLLAWFAPEPVPLRILECGDFSPLSLLHAPQPPTPDDGSPPGTVEQESGDKSPHSKDAWDTERLEAALAALADFSMLRWDADAETVTVHRVVQEILRTRQAEPQANLTAALRLLDTARPKGNADDVRTWPAWEPLRPHVAFAVLEGKRLEIAVPTSRLMGYLGTLLWAKALHKEAETLERDALAIDEKHFGPDSTEVAVRLNNLAGTLWNMNRLSEAEPLMRRALAIDEQSYGAEHPNVARHLNNLAALLQATNRLSEAEPLMRRALAIDERVFGAEPLMRRALAIDEQSYGAEHPDVAIRLSNLASLLYSLNRLSEAEPLMRRALAIDEQSYGAEHPDVAIDLNNLALLLKATNRLAEAEPLMCRALAIGEQSLGPDHAWVANPLNNLAMLLQATNRLADAEPLMRRMLDIFCQFGKTTGHEHPHMQAAIANYGQLLQAMGRSESEIAAILRDVTKP